MDVMRPKSKLIAQVKGCWESDTFAAGWTSAPNQPFVARAATESWDGVGCANILLHCVCSRDGNNWWRGNWRVLTGRRRRMHWWHQWASAASEGSDPAARDERQTPRALRLPAAAVRREGRGGPPAQADRPLQLDHRHLAQTKGRPSHTQLPQQISYTSIVSFKLI